MKTLFIAINSKYIHSALAPWYLKACCGNECGDTLVREYTINDSADAVLARIYRERPDVAAFSCYIWNIEFILKLASNLRKILPEVRIVLGGPEVSYDAAESLQAWNFADYIISGEGEVSIPFLLQYIKNDTFPEDNRPSLEAIPGLSYRNEKGEVCANPVVGLKLEDIPSPYSDEMLMNIGNRIVYYESSRGCPFSCSYCLSSITKGVGFFPMDRVKKDITRLTESGVRQIKFVDRTFNCNKERAAEIFCFIIEKFTDASGKAMLNFHFEAAADLFDDVLIEILAKAPSGLIQLEIGVQTVNTLSLEAINRKTDIDKLLSNFSRLAKNGNIHLHLDLIAGLPFDDYKSFGESFNRVYAAAPHQLQLGFLKLLKGSELRKRHVEFGYVFRNYPPYEVLSNKFINFDKLSELKGLEDLLDRYYNSGRFISSLNFLINVSFENAFAFYESLYAYYVENGLLQAPVAMKELYTLIYGFGSKRLSKADCIKFVELLRLDFLSSDSSGSLPQALVREGCQGFKEKCFDFLKSEANIKKYLPEFIGMPAKQIIKQVHFEPFTIDVFAPDKACKETLVLFDYSEKNAVSGLYRHVFVKFD